MSQKWPKNGYAVVRLNSVWSRVETKMDTVDFEMILLAARSSLSPI